MTAVVVTRARLQSIAPFFIVRDLARSMAFYRDDLGFDVTFQAADPNPFFAIVCRDGAQLLLKVIDDSVAPQPNPQRHPWARWDAYVHVPDPDALSAEFAGRGVRFTAALANTSDGLRGFELEDSDGYVLFFGRPI